MGCDCEKNCSDGCVPVGEIGPKGDKGDKGSTGNTGMSVIGQTVSDGVTPIGDTIYPINSLIFQFSDLSYFNAGVIYTVVPADIPLSQWVEMDLVNGWTGGIGASSPRYAIYNGFLYLSGRINFAAATATNFTQIPITGITGLLTAVVATNSIPAEVHTITVSVSGIVSVPNFATANIDTILLDSVVPIIAR